MNPTNNRNYIATRLRENPPSEKPSTRTQRVYLWIVTLLLADAIRRLGPTACPCFCVFMLLVSWHGLRWYRHRLAIACSIIEEQDRLLEKPSPRS